VQTRHFGKLLLTRCANVCAMHDVATLCNVDYFGGRVGKDMGEGSMNDLWSFDTSTSTWSEVQAQHGEPPCKVSFYIS
jgi:Galactose oxidase, central domain